jgi:hypothetical protein
MYPFIDQITKVIQIQLKHQMYPYKKSQEISNFYELKTKQLII